MQARPHLSRAAAAALILMAAACGDKQAERTANARAVIPGGERDATQPITSAELGFRLSLPGPGWKLLAEAEASRIEPQARAGALSPDGVTGVVMAGPAPPLDLDAYARSVVDGLALADKHVESLQEHTVAGRAARRFVVRGASRGVSLTFGGLVLLEGGLAYRLLAWGSQARIDERGSELDPFFAAFEIVGEASPRAPLPPPPQQSGVGWRVVDGVFESADSGLRVEAGDGWRLLVGRELEMHDREAEVGLTRTDPAVTILLFSEPVVDEARAELVSQLESEALARLEPDGDKAKAERVPFSLFDRQVGAQRWRRAGSEYLHAVHASSHRAVQMLARYRSDAHQAALAVLRSGLAGVSLLSRERVRELGGELDASGAWQHQLGDTYAIASGVFREFTHGLVWAADRGRWRLLAGERARRINRDATLYLEHRGLGLFGMIVAERAGRLDNAAYHKRIRDRLSARVELVAPPAGEARLAGLPALVSEGAGRVRGYPLHYRVVTAVREDLALQAIAWARPEIAARYAEQLGDVAGRLELDDTLRAIERTTDAYRGHRMGFEMRLPHDWEMVDRTPAELAPLGTLLRWEHRGRWIALLAVALDDPLADALPLGLLEQMLRDEYGGFARGVAEAKTASVAGLPARHVSWRAALERYDLLLARRGGVAYALVAVDKDEAALEELRQAFRFVPEAAAVDGDGAAGP